MRLERHVPLAWSKLLLILAPLVIVYKIRYRFIAKISQGLLNNIPFAQQYSY